MGRSEYQVLVPYEELTRLIQAGERVEHLEKRLTKQAEQMAALRSQYVELLDEFRRLRDFVMD